MELQITEETIEIAREILVEGKLNGINGKVPEFEKCFDVEKSVTAKHILWGDFVKATGCQIPKVFGYMVMDKVFGMCTGKDLQGYAGYNLKCNLSVG